MMSLSRRVAIVMPDKTLQNIDLEKFRREFRKFDLDIFTLDLNRPVEEQKPFGAILHKITDVISKSKKRDQDACRKLYDLEIFLMKHPDIVVVEPIGNVRKILDRPYCFSVLRSSSLRNIGVSIPNFAVIRNGDPNAVKRKLRELRVSYPILAKPLCGNEHSMTIVFDEEHLGDLPVPCVAQSFVPHGAVVYKACVVGNHVDIVRRPSLADLRAGAGGASLRLDGGAASDPEASPGEVPQDAATPPLNYALCDTIAGKVAALFGVYLLAVDVVIEETTGEYFVVDVDNFPCYPHGIPDWHERVASYVRDKYEVKKY